ncbi:MAG: hypothetical protein ACP5RI_03985, partial [Candidatus Micrarchaeia archaeon]
AFIKTTKKISNIPNGTILNIGSGNEHTVLELFELLKDITGYTKDPIINENYLLKDELSIWKVSSIKKTEKTINWKPNYNLKEGLVKTVEWFKKNVNLYEDEKL